MGFKCLFVHRNWTTLAPEDSFIKYYRKSGEGECASERQRLRHARPGRERETTNKAPDGVDAHYLIRQDWTCDWIKAGERKAAEPLKAIKGDCPICCGTRPRRRGPMPTIRA